MGKKKSGGKAAAEPAPSPAPVENPNLAVLKRRDASLIDVIATSGHVVVYRYAGNGWTKHNVEGPLFIVSRARAPHYRLVVLNRVTMHNLVEDLSPDFQMERNGPYLMYANSKGDTLGFWFPEESRLEEMQGQMLECIAKLKAGKHPKAKPKTPPKEKPQQKPPTVVKAVLPRPAAPANQPAVVSSGAPPETGHAQHGMPLGHNGNAAAAAAIMAAVGMQQPAPNMQQMPLTHISPPLMPQPSPQPIPQAVRPPAGASAMRSAAVSMAQAFKGLNGGVSMSAEEIVSTLKQLSDNQDFVQMMLLAQTQVK